MAAEVQVDPERPGGRVGGMTLLTAIWRVLTPWIGLVGGVLSGLANCCLPLFQGIRKRARNSLLVPFFFPAAV